MSSNVLRLKPSSTLAINEKSKMLAPSGKKLFLLGFRQSPFPVPSIVVDALKQNAFQKDHLPPKGLMKLRRAVATRVYKVFLLPRKRFCWSRVKRADLHSTNDLGRKSFDTVAKLGFVQASRLRLRQFEIEIVTKEMASHNGLVHAVQYEPVSESGFYCRRSQ